MTNGLTIGFWVGAFLAILVAAALGDQKTGIEIAKVSTLMSIAAAIAARKEK